MLTVRSGCKINLFLNVLHRRDDGFHELESVMQPIGLYDQLTIEAQDRPAIDLTCAHPEVPLGPENLVCKAAKRFLEANGIEGGVKIHLEKKLPVAAGVGGGSGNAAATLTGLNALNDGMMGDAALWALAAELGSDVPFFLSPGPGIATGRGERVESLPAFSMFEDSCVILVNPGFGVPTPWAYKHLSFDEGGVHSPITLGNFLSALNASQWSEVMSGLFNSLEQPVFRKYPILQLIRSGLLEAGADGALLSGSGATVFGIVRDGEQGEAVRHRFLEIYEGDCWSQVVPLGA